jgi:hypothetical protein
VLNETVPTAVNIGFLVNPSSPYAESETKDAQTAAEALGKKLLIAKAGSESALEPAYSKLVEQGVGGLLVAAEPFFHAARGVKACLGLGRREDNLDYLRWYFTSPTTAAAFAAEFGGTHLAPARK